MQAYLPWLWLALTVLFGILEGMTVQLVSIWFCVGGIAALIVSLVTPNFTLQFAAFVVVSALALAISRKVFRSKMRPKKVATNADMVLGKEGIVLKEITPEEPGRVKVDGQDWAARCGVALPAGARCRVEGLSGVTLTVLPIESESTVSV